MVEVLGLRIGKAKEEKEPTLETKLSELGVHLNTDQFFRDRIQNIKDELTELMPNEVIDEMGISMARKTLLKQTMRRLRYCWSHVPFGKAIEKPRYGRAMQAARDLLLLDVQDILSDAAEDDIRIVVYDDFAQIDKLVAYSFDSQNTSINKSVVVQNVQKDKRYGSGEEEEV